MIVFLQAHRFVLCLCFCAEAGGAHWIILGAPGRDPSEQRPNASESLPLKQQRDSSSGGFVRAGTIDDYIAVVRELVTALLDVLEHEVYGSRDHRGVALQFHPRAQIENHWIFAG